MHYCNYTKLLYSGSKSYTMNDYESWAAVVVAWESAAERTEMILPRSRPRVGGEEIDCRNQGSIERIHDKGRIERASRRAAQCIRTR